MAYNGKMTGSKSCHLCGEPFCDDKKKLLIHKDMNNPRMFDESCANVVIRETDKWSEYRKVKR